MRYRAVSLVALFSPRELILWMKRRAKYLAHKRSTEVIETDYGGSSVVKRPHVLMSVRTVPTCKHVRHNSRNMYA